MTIADEAAALIRAGGSNKDIARQLHIRRARVAEVRRQIGIPNVIGKRTARPPEDLYQQRTRPLDGGHLAWTGTFNSVGVPVVHTAGGFLTAYRIAFRIGHGRDPVGQVQAGCDQPRCVHPDHVEDQAMRDQYRAIFGGAM
ncbi:hypothetical protein [Streptomyces sp. KL116D]|uniref:hypothetical protein n=1 Tax=Streptomyces sp. KL116D TaxID=3045152 RepID=UPI003556F631